MGLLKEFLQTIFQNIEYSHSAIDLMILPRDILALPQDQLIFLIDFGLIKKHKYPKKAWCNNCNVVCEVEFANNKEFLVCLECFSQEKINSTNSMQYSSGLTEISEFLQNILGLDNKVEIVEDNRLLYLGYKGKLKYYFLHGIHQTDCLEMLQSISNAQHACILALENNHTLKVPQTLLIYNILDFLSFEDTKFILALPQITYTNSIASLGGEENAKKYSEVRSLIISEFNKEQVLNSKLTLKNIYNIIANKIRNKFPNNLYTTQKKPTKKKGHCWLKDDNLENYIEQQIKNHKK